MVQTARVFFFLFLFQTKSVYTLFGRISLRWATCAKVNLKIAAVAATAAAAPRPAINSAPDTLKTACWQLALPLCGPRVART